MKNFRKLTAALPLLLSACVTVPPETKVILVCPKIPERVEVVPELNFTGMMESFLQGTLPKLNDSESSSKAANPSTGQ